MGGGTILVDWFLYLQVGPVLRRPVVLVGKASQMRFNLSSQTGSNTTKGGYVSHEGDDPRVDSGHG